MDLKIDLKNNGSADGLYSIKADGYDTAALYWADDHGMLPEWTAFGYTEIDRTTGFGTVAFCGGRSFPAEATHVCVKAFRHGSTDCREELFWLERERSTTPGQPVLRCGILTDLHLTRKAGAVKFALRAAADADCILLPGDITNNGSEEEFKLFEACLDETVPGVPVYSVNGNHDLMGGGNQYAAFHNRKASWQSENRNVCYASSGEVELIGINAGALWTSDVMRVTPEQLASVDALLGQNRDTWKIIACHTPLSRNMPVRNGHLSTYLSRDGQLQRIIDAHENIIFLSGHTHLSPSLNSGVVSFDPERSNLYINCGSIRPTELGREAKSALPEWKEGNVVELRIMEKALEVRMRTIYTRKWISRGYYVIRLGEGKGKEKGTEAIE